MIVSKQIFQAITGSRVHPRIIQRIPRHWPEKTVFDYLVAHSSHDIKMYSDPIVGTVITETTNGQEQIRYVQFVHPQTDLDEPCLENLIAQTTAENKSKGYAQLLLDVLNPKHQPKEQAIDNKNKINWQYEDDEPSPPPRYA